MPTMRVEMALPLKHFINHKQKNMRSKVIDSFSKGISLRTRLKVGIESHFIFTGGGSFFMPASEEGPLYDEIMAKNKECLAAAQPILDIIERELTEWENDGNP